MTRNSRPALIGVVLVATFAALIAVVFTTFKIQITGVTVPDGYELKCRAEPKPIPLKIEVTK